MPEEILKFIDWIGTKQYYKSGRTGYWSVSNAYGNANNTKVIAKTTTELYEIYKLFKKLDYENIHATNPTINRLNKSKTS